jgi:hypothetical protein
MVNHWLSKKHFLKKNKIIAKLRKSFEKDKNHTRAQL